MSRQKKTYSNGQPRTSPNLSTLKTKTKRYAEGSPDRQRTVAESIDKLTRMYGKPVTR